MIFLLNTCIYLTFLLFCYIFINEECRLQQASADNLASHPGRLNDNEHSAFSDYPASSQLDKKLSSEEVINIKEATSNREKDELLQGDQAIESDAFLFHKPRTNRLDTALIDMQ